jgi:hypothetical protein
LASRLAVTAPPRRRWARPPRPSLREYVGLRAPWALGFATILAMKPGAISGPVAVVLTVSVGASCNALWGVGDLEYRGAGGAAFDGGLGGAGGVPGDGSTGGGSTGGAGGGGGGQPCDMSSCESCVTTGCAPQCDAQQDLCLNDSTCLTFAACVQQCGTSDGACQSACALASPGVVHSYYRWLDCAACGDQGVCSAVCDGMCPGECSTGGACLACANETCAQEVCVSQILACAANFECLSFNDCVHACTSQACHDQCVDTHSAEAITLYNHWSRCVICTKAACWDDCAVPPFNCAGY